MLNSRINVRRSHKSNSFYRYRIVQRIIRLVLSLQFLCLRCFFKSFVNIKLTHNLKMFYFSNILNNLALVKLLIMFDEINVTNFNKILDSSKTVNRDSAETAKNALLTIQGKTSINKTPVKSVLNLSAQIAGLCENRKYKVLLNTVESLLSYTNNELTTYEKAIIELQFLYGLRISEALNVSFSDINYNGSIMVRGLKGSENRLVYPVRFVEFWLHVKKTQYVIPSSYNRFYFYRLYKKKGIYNLMVNNSNNSVTHILRYNFIANLLKTGTSIDQIQHILGHKSLKSTLYYVGNLFEK